MLLFFIDKEERHRPIPALPSNKNSVGCDRAHIARVSSGLEIRIRARLEGVPKDAPEKEGFSRCRGHPDSQLCPNAHHSGRPNFFS